MTRINAAGIFTTTCLTLLCAAAFPLMGLAQDAEPPAQTEAASKQSAAESTDAVTEETAAPAVIEPPSGKVFDARTITLENGMQVVVVENNRVPVITHMVWYRTGAADEPRGKSGIAACR